MAIEIVPMVIKQIIEQLTKAGSPFDKRFKRMMSSDQSEKDENKTHDIKKTITLEDLTNPNQK